MGKLITSMSQVNYLLSQQGSGSRLFTSVGRLSNASYVRREYPLEVFHQ